MKTVNVNETETTLSLLLEEVEHGETVLFERDGKPIAQLTAIARPNMADAVAELRAEFKLRTAGINIRDAINEGRR